MLFRFRRQLFKTCFGHLTLVNWCRFQSCGNNNFWLFEFVPHCIFQKVWPSCLLSLILILIFMFMNCLHMHLECVFFVEFLLTYIANFSFWSFPCFFQMIDFYMPLHYTFWGCFEFASFTYDSSSHFFIFMWLIIAFITSVWISLMITCVSQRNCHQEVN